MIENLMNVLKDKLKERSRAEMDGTVGMQRKCQKKAMP